MKTLKREEREPKWEIVQLPDGSYQWIKVGK